MSQGTLVGKSTQYYSGFDPRGFSDMSLWMDGKDVSTVSVAANGTVSTWTDKSGNGRVATAFAIGAGLVPRYDAEGMFMTSGYFTISPLLPSGPYFETMFFVVNMRSTTQKSMIIGDLANAARTIQVSANLLTTLRGNTAVLSIGTVPRGLKTLITVVTSGRIVNHYINGIFVGTAAAQALPTTGETIIGAHATSFISPMIGTIHEILLYNSDFNDMKRSAVESYLMRKWKINTTTPVTAPTDIPNCKLWLDANDSNTISNTGANMTRWLDKSGSNNHADKVGTSAFPIYIASGIGTGASVNFPDGASMVSPMIANTSNETGFFVVNVPSWGAPLGSRVITDASGGRTITATSGRQLNLIGNGSTLGNQNTVDNGATVVIDYVLQDQYSNTSFQVSKMTEACVPYTPMTTGGRTILGSGSATGGYVSQGGRTLVGYFKEAIIYDSNLTNADRNRLRAYLENKWNPARDTSYNPILTQYPPIVRNAGFPQDSIATSVWLDAADTSTLTLSGTNVTGWRNKITSNATNLTATVFPTYSSADRAVVFSGTQWLSNTVTQVLMAGGFSMFAVHKPDNITATNGNVGIVSLAPGSGTTIVWPHMDGATARGFVNTGSTTMTLTTSTQRENSVTTDYNIICVNCTPSNTFVYNNGVQQSSNLTNITTATTTAGMSIGRARPTGTVGYYQGKLREFILINRWLNPDERRQIEWYLATKWGLTYLLASDHPYRSGKLFIPTFQPLSISNVCRLWLDFSDPVGGLSPTGDFLDKSPRKYVFTPIGNPGYGVVTINGKIRTFRLFLNEVKLTTAGFAWPTNCVIFMVMKSYFGNFLMSQQDANADESLGYRNYVWIANQPFLLINGVFAGSCTPGPPVGGKWGMFQLAYVSGTTLASARMGGTEAVPATSTAAGNTTITTNLWINGNRNSNYAFDLCELGEILMYSGPMTIPDIARIEGYLSWKWGLEGELPDYHPYKKLKP